MKFPSRLLTYSLFLTCAVVLPNLAVADPTENDKTCYLAAYFWEKKGSDGKEDSKLYYAIAKDGFRFEYAVKDCKPVVSASVGDKITRDPMILRDPNGGFHLIATSSWKGRSFELFDSTDLVHWTNERLIQVSPGDADMTWAPELRWDPETKQYFAYWTSSEGNKWSTACIWYATSTDLKTFSEPKVLMREKDGCLDADIVQSGGKWHMVYRYIGIWMRTADHAFGPYENPTKISDFNVEGPFLFPINQRDAGPNNQRDAGPNNQRDAGPNNQHDAGPDKWGLIFDYFGGNQGRWGLSVSTNFTDWNLQTKKEYPYYTPDVFFPPGVRHGSVLPITDAEADLILKGFGYSKYDYKGVRQAGSEASAQQ